jgi:hypothetical protein
LFDAALRKCNYATNVTCAEITTTAAATTTTVIPTTTTLLLTTSASGEILE